MCLQCTTVLSWWFTKEALNVFVVTRPPASSHPANALSLISVTRTTGAGDWRIAWTESAVNTASSRRQKQGNGERRHSVPHTHSE